MPLRKMRASARNPYQHFPNKGALLAALLDLRHATLDKQSAVIASEERDAGSALERCIDALGDWMLAYHGLPEPLRAACQLVSALTPACLEVIEITETFVRATQDSSYARQPLEGRDIFPGPWRWS